jgi:excisionase family DNA binding protein
MKSHSSGVACEALVVRPGKAAKLLDCGRTHVYALLNIGELDSYADGAARKITVESIHRHIARKLANSKTPARKEPASAFGPVVQEVEDASPPYPRQSRKSGVTAGRSTKLDRRSHAAIVEEHADAIRGPRAQKQARRK